MIVCHEKKEDNKTILQLIGTKRNVEFLMTPLSPRAPYIGWKGEGVGQEKDIRKDMSSLTSSR